MPRQPRHPWKSDEDEILLALIEAGKSWVLISAKLKRSIVNLQLRHRVLRRSAARVISNKIEGHEKEKAGIA
jgi:hypothetical protein